MHTHAHSRNAQTPSVYAGGQKQHIETYTQSHMHEMQTQRSSAKKNVPIGSLMFGKHNTTDLMPVKKLPTLFCLMAGTNARSLSMPINDSDAGVNEVKTRFQM